VNDPILADGSGWMRKINNCSDFCRAMCCTWTALIEFLLFPATFQIDAISDSYSQLWFVISHISTLIPEPHLCRPFALIMCGARLVGCPIQEAHSITGSWPTDKAINAITSKAAGHFIVASIILGLLSSCYASGPPRSHPQNPG
jgi:hypothetical protein